MREQSRQSSREQTRVSEGKRDSTATKTATLNLVENPVADPELAAVVGAWDQLPAAVRAGILAMVKASKTE